LYGHGSAALGLDVGHGFFRALLVTGVIDHHRSSGRAQSPCDPCADALGSTGDHRHFALKIAHCLSPVHFDTSMNIVVTASLFKGWGLSCRNSVKLLGEISTQ